MPLKDNQITPLLKYLILF